MLLIKNGSVFDRNFGLTRENILISDGIVVKGSESAADRVVDAEGCLISPGWIDMHVHVFENATDLGLRTDGIGVNQGVTTVVDAGSAGLNNFRLFLDTVVKKNKTTVLNFINVSRKGLAEGKSELTDTADLMTADELARLLASEEGKGIVGIKVRMSASVLCGSGLAPLVHARALADAFRIPLCIHIGNFPPALGDILNLLQKGDIVTHSFHGKKGGMPEYRAEFQAALKRGVHFDVGHGSASFSFETFKTMSAAYPVDYSISTDLHTENRVAPVISLARTMTKFLAMGVPVEEVVRKVTLLPRRVLRLEERCFPEPGSRAGDLSVFEVREGKIKLTDSERQEMWTTKYFRPRFAIKNGSEVFEVDGEA